MENQQELNKTMTGVVVSDAMDKTATVKITRRVRHPLYEKFITKSTKIYAHDEDNSTHVGDKVVVEQCRPLSKMKRWKLVKIVEKAS